MLQNKIVRSNGQIIDSNSIVTCEYSESVNQGTNISVGNMIAAQLIVEIRASENLISQGEEFTYYQIEDGEEKKVGVFIADKPTVVSRSSYEVTAYDRISKTEVDFSDWLYENGESFPMNVGAIVSAACAHSGVVLDSEEFEHSDLMVSKFFREGITCRQIISWGAAIAGKNVRANADGALVFCWYSQRTDVIVSATNQETKTIKYFRDGLSYENYHTAAVERVRVAPSYSDIGAEYPEDVTGNCFTLTNNTLVDYCQLTDLTAVAQTLYIQLSSVTYVPASVSIVKTAEIQAGDIISIVDIEGKTFDTYVMRVEITSNGTHIEGTGDRELSSGVGLAVQRYNESEFKKLSPIDIFNKLTNNGGSQGLYLSDDGQIYINAAYIATGILASKDGKTFHLDLDNGILTMQATELTIAGKTIQEIADEEIAGLTQEEIFNILTDNGNVKGIILQDNQLYISADYINTGTLNASLMTAGVLQSKDDGETFYLDLDNGVFHMIGTGKFMSADGKSYITLEGSEFVLYAKQGENGEFADIARIGFTEDSEGDDYPYILMGSADEDGSNFDKIGLIKMFKNGLYFGNSAPRGSTGSFVGLTGASGLFVDTTEPRPYLVNGTELADAFECVFA